MKIIQRKNITITQDFSAFAGNPRVFSSNINLNFTPDEMIVRGVAISSIVVDAPFVSRVFLLRCSTINETLTSFNLSNNPINGMTFVSKNYPINSRWDFQIFQFTNATTTDNSILVPNTDYFGSITIHLEFVQYG